MYIKTIKENSVTILIKNNAALQIAFLGIIRIHHYFKLLRSPQLLFPNFLWQVFLITSFSPSKNKKRWVNLIFF